MTAFGFRWYGPEDAVTLEHIRQIPPVTELVTSLYHIPAGALWPEEDIAAQAAQAAAAGLHFSVAEGLPVHESIKLGGPERERYIGQFVENLERLARHGVHTVCYNFMPCSAGFAQSWSSPCRTAPPPWPFTRLRWSA